MKHKSVIAVLIFLLYFLVSPGAQEEKFIQKEYKEEKIEGMVFQWKIEDQSISIILSAPTEGWVSVGFNPSSMMKDANFIIGFVDKDKLFIRDDFGSGRMSHKSDTKLEGEDNIFNASGSETDGITTLEFSIPLNSGDPNDTILEEGKEYKIIFAYGKKDSFTSYHRAKGSLMITL